jgi:hypothetical protein
MRFVIPLLSVLLLAGAAPAEEPAQSEAPEQERTQSEAPASAEALAALESRLGVVQDQLEHDEAASLELSMRETLAKRVNDGLVRRAAPPAAVPARRAPAAASEQAESSPMTCRMVDAKMDCRLLASRGSR